MTNVGRNDPCPCGSGNKYKRCCLSLHEAAGRERHRQRDEPITIELLHDESAELEELSNRVNRLIRQGELERAEELSHQLQRRFPDQLDGIEGLARVYEARGESLRAAEHYRKAALLAERGKGYDQGFIADLRQRASALDPSSETNESPAPPPSKETSEGN